MSKRDIEIKITKDKRFNVAGLTVDTLDETFTRYDKKMKREQSDSNWYSLYVDKSLVDIENKCLIFEMWLPGNSQFVTTCVNDLLNLM